MQRQAPYLQRRGYTLSFRIAVPCDLRALIGERELTKALCTADKRIAAPIALELAAVAKRLFNDLRLGMAESNNKKFQEQMIEAKIRMRRIQDQERHEDDIDEIQRQHREVLNHVRLEAENETLKRALEHATVVSASMPPLLSGGAPETQYKVTVLTFHYVVDSFLDEYPKTKKPSMFKKHQTVLSILKEFVGDIPINQLKQSHIKDFFSLLQKLPRRWKDQCRQKKITISELAELEHLVTLGPKSIEDTYIASVRPFLYDAITQWQDQGFPTTLTTRAIKYKGDREEGEEKQRALSQAELKRLFEGPEIAKFAADPGASGYYWLPHIGLFTGARVNEICQLNPQTDILQDAECGVWHFWITEDTEGDDRIVKRTKNKESRRKIPIHSKLIELGILAYINSVKSQGARLLFPHWKPSRGKASPAAEKWFRQLIRDTGLRDQTPGGTVLGMHVFRHTLESEGQNTKGLPWPIEHITGHAIPGKTKVARGYSGELTLPNKQEIIEAISFNLKFALPVAPLPLHAK